MRRSEPFLAILPHTLAALLALACGGDSPTAPPPDPPTPPPPTSSAVAPTIKATAGDSASAIVGQAPAQVPTIVITDTLGKHPSGIVVRFTPDSVSGSVASPNTATDTLGVASAGKWTLGVQTGVQHLTASALVDGTTLQVTFTATAKPVIPASLALVSGGAQSGPMGASLVTPTVIRALDRDGKPVRGAVIRFGVDSGAVLTATGVTAADGTVSTRMRLPMAAGSAVLTASVDSGPSVQSTFTAHGIHFVQMGVYGNDACGLSVEGYLYCWGDNSVGQLAEFGITKGQDALSPQPTGDLSLVSFSLQSEGGCGLHADSTATCWGSNTYGNNGNGQENNAVEAPSSVTGQLKFVELGRGPSVSCGTTTGGQSYCWGAGGLGQIGNATYYGSSTPQPVAIDGGITFHSYALGNLHTCALDPSGQAYCWGADWDGRLGVASASRTCNKTVISGGTTTITPETCSASPVTVNTSVRFTMLSASDDATCGETAAGETYCWGSNSAGELATGDNTPRTDPTKIAGLPPLVELHGSMMGFCGLTAAGDIYCWGGGAGNLGGNNACSNSPSCQTVPMKLNVSRQFSTIAFTLAQMCGISSGVAYCWGENYHGVMGIGSVTPPYTPTPTAVLDQTP